MVNNHKVPIYFSERRFEVLTWGAGHQGLLLRSLISDRDPLRVEICFKPAYAVCLASALDGLWVTEQRDGANKGAVEREMGRGLNAWEHMYEVVTPIARGWVVGGSVSGRQDRRWYDDPTMFDGWEPREGVEELFSVNG